MGQIVPQRPQKGATPTDSWMSDFWQISELPENEFLLAQATKSMQPQKTNTGAYTGMTQGPSSSMLPQLLVVWW